MQSVDLTIDVTRAAGLDGPAHIAVTVTLPDAQSLNQNTIVCFGKPGGGYSRGYYTLDLPGPGHGAQADWHASRGWIFVSVDHLGVGDSSTNFSPETYTFTALAATAQAAEREVLQRLQDGTLLDDFPPVTDPVVLGIGQSMGGCMNVSQQGRYECYDGIGILGYSAVHTHPPELPGTAPITVPWIPRDVIPNVWVQTDPSHDPGVVNKSAMAKAMISNGMPESGPSMAWGFHYSDVPEEVLDIDLADFPIRNGNPPPWASTTLPVVVALWCLQPGAVAPEAAGITVPILIAQGERDVLKDPKGEARAYQSATSIDWYRCPRMGHMHNFAGTRELFWQRIHHWAEWVRVEKLTNASQLNPV